MYQVTLADQVHSASAINPVNNMKILNVTDETFAVEVGQSSIPVFVDFWAPWCRPCKAIAPTIEILAEQYVGKVKFVKMNTDDNQRTPANFNIRGIPTVIVFKNGLPLDVMVGAQSKSAYQKMLETL